MEGMGSKILGFVALLAVFTLIIMGTVYPAINGQGDQVSNTIEQQTTKLEALDSGNWQ